MLVAAAPGILHFANAVIENVTKVRRDVLMRIVLLT